MKYIIPTLIAMLAFAHPAFSQENDSMARKSFAMAQSAFAEGQYKETIDYLKYAELYSGGANSRSLYLKIKALNQLSNTDKTYLPALQSSINKFFEITDKGTYPQEKYKEITGIMNSQSKSTGSSTTAPAGNSGQSKSETEKADYDKAIKAHTKDAYKEFLDKYSYTPLSNDIKKKYQEMVEDDDEYRDHRR